MSGPEDAAHPTGDVDAGGAVAATAASRAAGAMWRLLTMS
jgi:hypothetical protein